MNISDKEFYLLKEYLLTLSGIDIPEEKRYLFCTRLTDLLHEQGCSSFGDFYAKLTSGQSPLCRRLFVESMTTHESAFFRDGHPYLAFIDTVLPLLSKQKSAQARFLPPTIRVLSAGCGFGQEPYSIAIGMRRFLPTQNAISPQDVAIVGVDISTSAIERAKKGLFTELEIGKYLSIEDRITYFVKKGDRWLLSEEIRRMVAFESRNLDAPISDMGKFDAIFCRNVIIYFPFEVRKQLLKRLRAMLEPEGVLFLGSAESLFNMDAGFSSRSVGETTYYINSTSS
jgi:chemotaxis protein methyltransferase CheR